MSDIRTLVVWRTDKNLDFEIPERIQVTWANPKFWNGVPRPIHDAVYAPDHPEIEKVHEEHGKVIWRPEGVEKASEEKDDVQADERTVVDDVPDVDREHEDEAVEEESPNDEEESDNDDWRDLSWPKMRSLAATLTDEPIKSKAQAQEVLEQAEQDGKL